MLPQEGGITIIKFYVMDVPLLSDNLNTADVQQTDKLGSQNSHSIDLWIHPSIPLNGQLFLGQLKMQLKRRETCTIHIIFGTLSPAQTQANLQQEGMQVCGVPLNISILCHLCLLNKPSKHLYFLPSLLMDSVVSVDKDS